MYIAGVVAAGLLLSAKLAISAPPSRAVVQIDRTPIYSLSMFSNLPPKCASIQEKARTDFGRFLQPDSALFQELNLLIPNAFRELKKANLHIFIDEINAVTPEHSAYFIANYPKKSENAVILGCDQISQSYWEKSLAHELTHLLLRNHKIPTWFNEGLAQLVEHNLGGIQPELRLRRFQDATLIPALEGEAGLFKNKNSYGLSYLLVSYLFEHFGGWDLFSYILGNTNSRCRSEVFWETLICQGQSFLAGSGQDKKFTEKGLLRFFAIALSLNHPKYPLYQITKWGGFTTSPGEAPLGLLKVGPAQVFLFDSASFVTKKLTKGSKHLEIYRVVADDQRFQIFPLSHSKNALSVFNSQAVTNDFVVVINISATQPTELAVSE